MDIILGIILPVFGTMLLGYIAARLRIFNETANYGLSLFVFNVAIPIMLFRAMALTLLPEQIPWGYLLSYFTGTFAALGCGILAGRFIFRRSLAEQGIMGMSSSFSNTSMLGIPLILTAFGQPAALPLFVIIACHSTILLPPITLIIEAGSGRHEPLKVVLRRLSISLATTPIFWGLAAGLLMSAFQLKIPGVIDAVSKNIGNSAVPCALFSLGASLTCYRITGNIIEPLVLVFIKGILHPFFVWLLATQLFGVTETWSVVALTIAALPSGVMTYVYAQRYQVCQETSATTVFLSTLASVVTLSTLLFLFK